MTWIDKLFLIWRMVVSPSVFSHLLLCWYIHFRPQYYPNNKNLMIFLMSSPFRVTWFSFVTKPLSALMSDPTATFLLQPNAPGLPLASQLYRTPRRQEGTTDILELLTKDDTIQYILDVTMEVRNHVRATRVDRSSIKKELLDVLEFARKLQVIFFFLKFIGPCIILIVE